MVCVYTPEPKCVCPPGYEMVDSADWFKDLRLIKKFSCNPNSFKLLQLLYTDFYGYSTYDGSRYADVVSFEKCRETCINDCDCVGFGYSFTGARQCYHKPLLISGYQSPGVMHDMYLKISVNDSSATNVSSLSTLMHPDSLQCSQIRLHIAAKKRKRNQLIIPITT